MTKFRATVVMPLDKQVDRDGQRIDPAGLKFDPDAEHLIFRGFNYNVPEDVVGHGKLSRAEDGSIVMEGEIDGPIDRAKLAVGAMVGRMKGDTVVDSTLVSVGAVANHPDPNQPFIEKLP